MYYRCLLVSLLLFLTTSSFTNTIYKDNAISLFFYNPASVGDTATTGLITQNNQQIIGYAHNNSQLGYGLRYSHEHDRLTWSVDYHQWLPQWSKTLSPINRYNAQERLDTIAFIHGYDVVTSYLFKLNLFAGIGSVNSKNNLFHQGDDDATADSRPIKATSHFNGIGPELGVSITKSLGGRFTLANTLTVGMAYGTFDADFTTTQMTVKQHRSIIVPHTDINLAIGYGLPTQSWLIAIGVQYSQLWNAAQVHAIGPYNESVAMYAPFASISYRFE